MTVRKVGIVVDSTATLPSALVSQYQIFVAPQLIIFGTEVYQDQVDITPAEFYTRMTNSKEMPTTAQVPVQKFEELIRQASAGGRDVLVITISNDLSGTVNSALKAQENLKSQIRVEVVDSRTTTMAMGFVVLAAARAAEQGADLATVANLARATAKRAHVLITVDTLEYLHRGGRIGSDSRLLGSVLNIKPTITIQDGKAMPGEKVRTRKKALEYIVNTVQKSVQDKPNARIAAIHCNCQADAQFLQDALLAQIKPVETLLAEVSPVFGVHVGPGTVGICWVTD